MKKFLKLFSVLLILAAFSFKADAQLTLRSSDGNISDTVVNGATAYLQSGKITSYSGVVIIVFTATEISGTSGGTATLQGSLDGTNWYTIGSAYTVTDVASQTTHWKVTDAAEMYYRVSHTGTGTMSSRITAKLNYYRKT